MSNEIKEVYVVTSGEYSDYRIVAIFLDKTKAEECAKCNSSYWDTRRVETYPISDSTFQVPTEYKIEVQTIIAIPLVTGKSPYVVDTTKDYYDTNCVDIKRDLSFTYLCERLPGRKLCEPFTWYLKISRGFSSKNFNMDAAETKVTKIGFDMAAKVKSLVSEGQSFEMIERMVDAGDDEHEEE